MNIYLDLFLSFMKISFFTIGGGYAMIPLIQSTVTEKGWMTQDMLISFIGIAESTPGPFSVNISTFVGYNMGGALGVLCASMGILLPPFVTILLIYYVGKKFATNPYVIGVMSFLRASAIALIFSAFVSIAYSTIIISNKLTGTPDFNWLGLVIMVLSFLGMRFLKKIHPVVYILLSAGLGILFYGFVL
ncbi:MAG TPA: chromate transporter [Clostridia bacterium]|jgi:chromate transporter|nr:chromate transporter [Clostridia bacterium]